MMVRLLSVFLCLLFAGSASAQPARTYWPTTTWQSASPASQNMDAAQIATAASYAYANGTQSLLIVRGGYLVHESYATGYHAGTVFDGYSIAKSVTSMAVGIAIANGAIPCANALASTWVTSWNGVALKSQITVSHLLNMTSGIKFANATDYPAMMASPNFGSYAATRPMENTPGLRWRYKADPNILANIIRAATGHELWYYTQLKAFNAIGITSNISWKRDPAGNANGSGDLKMTARHFARFGYLHLNRGKWNGAQLVPEAWIDDSTTPCQSETRVFANAWNGPGQYVSGSMPLEYKNLWWCRKFVGVPSDAYYAFGGVGQFVVVIPSLDMVVVRMGNGPKWPDGVFIQDLLNKITVAVN